MKTYHVCAMQIIEPGVKNYFDGTVRGAFDWQDPDAYSKLKELIQSQTPYPKVKSTILSLTVIEEC